MWCSNQTRHTLSLELLTHVDTATDTLSALLRRPLGSDLS